MKWLQYWLIGLPLLSLTLILLPSQTIADDITDFRFTSDLTQSSDDLATVYQWFSQQQQTSTGLIPCQQDTNASTYCVSLAVMVFILNDEVDKSKMILEYYFNNADEFFAGRCDDFNAPCSDSVSCDESSPCGFFQTRDAVTGDPSTDTNRWMGDLAWLGMAAHHYQSKTGDTRYEPMANAIINLLKSYQQPAGYIASGWENGDQTFANTGHAEGNLDAYGALLLFGETVSAQRVKEWLDYTDLDWKRGPLDLHSWRVLSLGTAYGFSLPDVERTDDETLRYRSAITDSSLQKTGFLHIPASKYMTACNLSDNIWVEGTGQMAVSYYKAGYREQGDFYVKELEKLLFEPTGFPGTQSLSFLALPDPLCHSWVNLNNGHVAAASWYIFAKEHFDPFTGKVMSICLIDNPIAKIEAENYDEQSGNGIRIDSRGQVSEGNALHVAGDEGAPSGNDFSGWITYTFSTLVPVNSASIRLRYADDVGGDTATVFLDSQLVTSFDTIDTGSWDDYTLTGPFLTEHVINPGLHTLAIEVTDNKTFGFTIDYVRFDGETEFPKCVYLPVLMNNLE